MLEAGVDSGSPNCGPCGTRTGLQNHEDPSEIQIQVCVFNAIKPVGCWACRTADQMLCQSAEGLIRWMSDPLDGRSLGMGDPLDA